MKDYKSSTKRIDGVITMIMSLDRALANKDEGGTGDFDNLLELFR
jgi:hypothetical protein